MGRVYNALLKAERLNANHPIGRPASSDAETRGQGDAATGMGSGSSDSINGQRNSNQKPEFNKASAQFNLEGAAAAPAFESQNLFPARDPQAGSPQFSARRSTVDPTAAPAPSQRPAASTRNSHNSANRVVAPQQSNHLSASPRHRVTASPSALAFEEPRKIARVEDLKVDAHLAAITHSDRLAAERYRTLAVRLGNLAARRKLKSLVITSATSGEGKTTVAINLAWALAKPGERRVLLVDASLNSPSVMRMIGIEPASGWLDLAEGRSSAADSMMRIDPNGLYVAAPRGSSGESKNDSALASTHIEKLIAQVESVFDLIVIDAPALLESADAEQMASIADGAVLVARACHTRRDRVSEAIDLIPEDRRLGVVLNESEIDSDNNNDHAKGRLPGLRSKRAERR